MSRRLPAASLLLLGVGLMATGLFVPWQGGPVALERPGAGTVAVVILGGVLILAALFGLIAQRR